MTGRIGSTGEYLTPADVARRLAVSKMTVFRLIQTGELPAIRAGRQYRIPTAAYESFVQRGGATL